MTQFSSQKKINTLIRLDSDTSLKNRIFDVIDDTYHESKPDRGFDFLKIRLILLNVTPIFLESNKAVYEQFREIASFIEIITDA